MIKFIIVFVYYLILYYISLMNDYDNINKVEKDKTKVHIYAIDFDNTICYTQYPKIIKPVPYAMKCLKILTDNPNSILILWTCRENEYLQQAIDYCSMYGVKFDYVNENCKELMELYGNDTRKIGADIYIDDKSYQGIEGIEKLWKNWYLWMKENKII